MKRIATVLVLMLLAVCMVVPAFAATGGEDVRTGTASGGSPSSPVTVGPNTSIDSNVNSTVNGIINDFAPNVTTNDIVNRLETKGNDVVTMLQTIGKYVCIGGFVICCILAIVVITVNPRLLWAGIVGMIVAGLAYAGIVCGREIINWIATWAIS